MSWTNELYRVYELMDGRDDNLLPVAHSTANAQIELTIDEHGNFKNAVIVSKEESVTIIPVTEDSGSRSSGICPMPFADKISYLAGDYSQYATGKKNDNSEYFAEYMKKLKNWRDSDNTHPSVLAIYNYLSQSKLMHDLIKSGILTIDDNGKLEKNKKINGISQEDVFIRFRMQYNNLSLNLESRTWLDVSLYNSFIAYNSTMLGNGQLCYATGNTLPCTYKHPKKIVNSAINAKIISSNDESGFSFRGRFNNKEEALSISYDFSQKMHNALKWLIRKQGKSYGTLTLVTWASALQTLPDEIQNGNIEDEWGEEENYDSLPEYRVWLSRYLMGYKQEFQNNTKVMILGLDAASPGRLSVSLYDELQASDFLHNLEHWHANSAWVRFDSKREKSVVKSCSLYEIIRAAYGIERNGKLECDDKLFRDSILKLLPCIMKRQHLPQNLIQALYHRASNPLSYDKRYNHRLVMEVICSMMRVKLNEETEGVEFMAYDSNEKNRSYLYGCLLAIADKAESDTYDKEDKENRVTNARRYWSKFSQRPYQTWGIIEEHLRPYLNQHPYKISIEKKVQEITEKFTTEEFVDNSRLEPLYLLGYHHFMAYMYKNSPKEEN